ncbi:MAG: YybS family protein [Proteobacteria bacterium]|nr:YybS family protein [Pseudomonadota bacterium]MBU1389115.1 YybS family protein [Pseudomonadota bacterium]MBU1543339.1 YybS family protein [Pseudomonadota bacterium]MBU2479818.1 YybS family protein [Pseudomonadota bacterium]
MTGTHIQPAAVKDILLGIFLCMLIILIMHILPVMDLFVWIFLPLPVLFYRLKVGRHAGGIIIAVCITVLAVLTGNIAFNLLYFGFFLMTGFFLGEYIEKLYGIEKIMIYTFLAVSGIAIVFLLVYAGFQNMDMGNLISTFIKDYKTYSMQIFSQTAQLYPQMEIDVKQLERVNSFFILMIPAIFMNAYITMMWLNIVYIKRLLSKKGITLTTLENLNHWKAPDFLIVCVIAAGFLLFLPIHALQIFSGNCLFVLMFIYFLQGISVVSFFFDKKSAPFVLRFFFYVFITIQPLLMFLVIGFGLFDNWFNFRKLDMAAR